MKSILGDKILFDWAKLKDLQPDGFKVPINIEHLKKSLKENGFAMPFFGWKQGKDVYIIDGHQRKQVLNELMQDGEDVPKQLEVQLINAETKRQAQEILFNVFNQKQNPINLEVAEVYIEQNNLEVEIESINFFVEKIEVEEVEEDVEHKENIKEITNIIAVALTEEEQEIWLNTKEQLGKLKDKNAIFELIKQYTNETNSKK